jgi:hypothetical protein
MPKDRAARDRPRPESDQAAQAERVAVAGRERSDRLGDRREERGGVLGRVGDEGQAGARRGGVDDPEVRALSGGAQVAEGHGVDGGEIGAASRTARIEARWLPVGGAGRENLGRLGGERGPAGLGAASLKAKRDPRSRHELPAADHRRGAMTRLW